MDSNSPQTSQWRRCSTCKTSIPFEGIYWVCSVSTCNKKRSGMVFCSSTCWDVHVPVMNHRDAWCTERVAPSRDAYDAESNSSKKVKNAAPPSAIAKNEQASLGMPSKSRPSGDTEILVIASKVKDYIRRTSGMNTSASVLRHLSHAIRRLADAGIQEADLAGRSTVLERDIPTVNKLQS